MKRKKPQPNPLYNVITKPLNRKFLRWCLVDTLESIQWAKNTDTTNFCEMSKDRQRELLTISLRALVARHYNYLYMRAHSGIDPAMARDYNRITGDALPERMVYKSWIYD